MNAVVKSLSLTTACCLMLGSVAAAELDPAGDIKAQAEKLVKVDNPEYLAAIKRVVITSYMVDFVSELKYTKSLSGLEAMIGADSDVSIKLVGSNNEQFQSITDKFYHQTVEQLKAQGIEVVTGGRAEGAAGIRRAGRQRRHAGAQRAGCGGRQGPVLHRPGIAAAAERRNPVHSHLHAARSPSPRRMIS